jgi:hypothetical protein
MVAKDYEAELEQIDRELEAELIRARYNDVKRAGGRLVRACANH